MPTPNPPPVRHDHRVPRPARAAPSLAGAVILAACGVPATSVHGEAADVGAATELGVVRTTQAGDGPADQPAGGRATSPDERAAPRADAGEAGKPDKPGDPSEPPSESSEPPLTLIATNARMSDIVMGLAYYGYFDVVAAWRDTDERLISLRFSGTWDEGLRALGVPANASDFEDERPLYLFENDAEGDATATRIRRMPAVHAAVGDKWPYEPAGVYARGRLGHVLAELCARSELECPQLEGDAEWEAARWWESYLVEVRTSGPVDEAILGLLAVTGATGKIRKGRLGITFKKVVVDPSSASVRRRYLDEVTMGVTPGSGPAAAGLREVSVLRGSFEGWFGVPPHTVMPVSPWDCASALGLESVDDIVVPLVVRGRLPNGAYRSRALVASRGHEWAAVPVSGDIAEQCVTLTTSGKPSRRMDFELLEISDAGVRFARVEQDDDDDELRTGSGAKTGAQHTFVVPLARGDAAAEPEPDARNP